MTGPEWQCANETLVWHRERAASYWQAAAAAHEDRPTRDHWRAHARWHETRGDKLLAALQSSKDAAA